MKNNKQEQIIYPDNLETLTFNTFRVGFSKSDFLIEVGVAQDETHNEQNVRIEIIAKLSTSPELIKPLILNLVSAALQYEADFKEDIGFKNLKVKK